MVKLRDHSAGDHDGSGLSLLQQMQMAHHSRKKTKVNAAMGIVVCHVRSLLKSNRGKLRDVFLKLDKDGGGSIDKNEFRRGLMGLGIELQDEEVDGVFSAIDVNGDGDVSLREFMSVVAKPIKPIKLIFHDFFDGIRSIGVYISREHAIAVYEHCQTKPGGPVDPKIDYDVEGNNKFPNLDKLIEKYSTAQIAAQERLAAVKARKKKLKREANEKALNRMVADAREMYSTI